MKWINIEKEGAHDICCLKAKQADYIYENYKIMFYNYLLKRLKNLFP